MLMISHSLYILTIPALLIYAAGLTEYLKNSSAPVMLQAGRAAAVLLVLSFSLVIITDAALTLSVAGSQQNTDIINLLFRLHAIAFVINAAVLGTAMIGFGYASAKSGVLPKWAPVMAITGGWLLIFSAVPVESVAMGSIWGITGLAGFICWLIWVPYTSVKMMKAG